LAGARSGLGVDVSIDVPEDCVSHARLEEIAGLLCGSSAAFLRAAGGSADEVWRRVAQLNADAAPWPFGVRSYDGCSIPLAEDSVDLIVSRSVLEHVRRDDVEPLLADLRRVLRPGGAMVHVIDMRDHMHLVPSHGKCGPSWSETSGDWLDALTYPEWLYRAMFSRSTALINRIRVDEWLTLFGRSGFEVIHREDHQLALPPSAREGRLQEPWRSLDPRVLSVAQVILGLR
jgi:SAM-dependent methyltransferase